MNNSIGVIYVATGRDYRDLARASVKSLRRYNPDIEVDLFTDDTDVPGLEGFDQVHQVPRVHFRSKIDCMPVSRFDRTLYLDCDTLIVDSFGDLFDLLDRFELAMAHDVRRCSSLIQEGSSERTPYAFPQLNSGVVLFRKSAATTAFFREWVRRYEAAGHRRDQITLKDLLWSSDLRFYVLPPEFNLRRVTVLDAWEPLDARPTIIHSHRLMDHLNGLSRAPVGDLETILKLERVALDEEWERLGVSPARRGELEVLLSGIAEGKVSAEKAGEGTPATPPGARLPVHASL